MTPSDWLFSSAKRECSLGLAGSYVNVYTRDQQVVDRVVAFLGKENVVEIAGEQAVLFGGRARSPLSRSVS